MIAAGDVIRWVKSNPETGDTVVTKIMVTSVDHPMKEIKASILDVKVIPK